MYIIISVLFISIIGTLLHFIYDVSNKNKIISLFAPVNESTWEHIKMGLSATFIWSLYDGYLFGTHPNYFFAKTASIIVLILMIPFIFYGYKIFTNKSILILYIFIFYISILLSQLTFTYIVNIKIYNEFLNYICVIILFVIFGFYMTLTILPIKSELFKDPITKKYGIDKEC